MARPSLFRMEKRKIGIIGTGRMGTAFGRAWARAGHAVLFGSRDRQKAERVATEVGARFGDFADAATFGDVVLFTVRPPIPRSLVAPESLAGRILVDCNNGPVFGTDSDEARGQGLRFVVNTPSIAERLAAEVPAARVVKAFNTIPSALLELSSRELEAAAISAFVAGDDPEARAIVSGLAEDIGFVAVDAGLLVQATFLEALADVVRHQILVRKTSTYSGMSFRVLRPS